MSVEFKNKYRPKTVEFVVGQPGIKSFFINAFKNKSVPQVMLFEGPKGTGKTTIARIIAMGLNCESSYSMSPCGKCKSCLSILSDSNPDYKEVNIGDKTGVGDMRSLTESFAFTPMYLDNKVFILDEAHQLTKAAQNKLLKDLEDTPENVYIILCTTEVGSLLPTLRDRCYTFRFNSLEEDDLRQILEAVLLFEKKDLKEDIKTLLVGISNGSARKLLVSLHKVLLLEDNTDAEAVISILGSEAELAYTVPKIVNIILKKDYKTFIKIVRKYNPKECNDLALSLVNYLGGMLASNPKRNISYLIDCIAPTLSIVNKGIFINSIYKYMFGSR